MRALRTGSLNHKSANSRLNKWLFLLSFFLWWLLSMKKSFLFLLTSYQGIGYILYVESRKQWQIKTLSPQSATNLNQGGVLGKQKTSNFQLSWKMTSRRSRNALTKIQTLPVRFWLLPRHWRNRRQIQALVPCSAVRVTAPTHISTRSNLTMNQFSFPVNGTGVPLHAFGGV